LRVADREAELVGHGVPDDRLVGHVPNRRRRVHGRRGDGDGEVGRGRGLAVADGHGNDGSAGLVGHGVHEFNEAGLIPAIVDNFYDLNFFLNEDTAVGQLFKAIFGYNGNPSLTESLAYMTYFVVLMLSLLRFQRGTSVQTA